MQTDWCVRVLRVSFWFVCVRDQVKQSCLERKHAADGCGCPAVTPSNGLMSIAAFIQLTISSSLCLPLSSTLACWQTTTRLFSERGKQHKKTIKTSAPFLVPSLHLQLVPNINRCLYSVKVLTTKLMPRFCFCCVTLLLFFDRNPNPLPFGTVANTKESRDTLFAGFFLRGL